MNKHYYKIDVFGRHGYSFMVEADEEMDDGNVIEAAKNYFESEADMDYCEVDNLVSKRDVDFFKKCGCVYKIG